MVDFGTKNATDGTCLPVKVCYGHVADLIAQGVDYVFLPRLISVDPREYICPKFMGLPDLQNNMFPQVKFLDPIVDVKQGISFSKALYSVGRKLGKGRRQIRISTTSAIKAQEGYEKATDLGVNPRDALQMWENGKTTLFLEELEELAHGSLDVLGDLAPVKEQTQDLVVGVLGHSYLLYDDYLSMNVIGRLQKMGVTVWTTDMLPKNTLDDLAHLWIKPVFWTSAKRNMGASRYYAQAKFDGVIYLSAFPCGTDSMTITLMEEAVRGAGCPFMILTVDEHTGEAGMLTRLEAFIDMIRWRVRR